MSFLIAQSLVNGVILGTLYLMMAIGFTLVFGVMRIVNFAHGEFYMMGAFAALIGVTWLGLPYALTLALTVAFAILLGALVERVVFRPFRSDELSGMIASLGLAMILQNGALLLFGPDPQAFPSMVSGVFRIGEMIIPKSRSLALGVGVVILVGFYVFLMHTRFGRGLRALVQDQEVAALYGVRPEIVYPLGLGLGIALAAAAGGLMAPLFGVSPFIGATPLLKAFIVVILGGLGSIPGAALAAMLLGLIESFTSSFVSASAADIVTFALVVGVLLVRPSGILGRGES
ncbi:branched-chain amino acid ABC transporter permease [Jiella pelagia]|uniref:Branched-chain amino acid ABC transporter permease n=1 Tax=Jiella pelagia TaxID=2986949 RepID=A0ABY7C179_9HYPH|nr:branched-chain amino acid ABC transporter permease [Jiella pelagia]WAP69839.1 branched-chain amino acid ABC transporter permease [Jiella pelagia]